MKWPEWHFISLYAWHSSQNKVPLQPVQRSRDSSVSIAIGYGLNGQGSIPGKGKILFSSPQHPDWLGPTQPPIQWVPGALPLGVKRPGREVTTHLHLVLRSRMVELYLHSPIRIHGVVLNSLSTETTLPFTSWTIHLVYMDIQTDLPVKYGKEFLFHMIKKLSTKWHSHRHGSRPAQISCKSVSHLKKTASWNKKEITLVERFDHFY
jgi:hypothetical protein